MFRHNVVEEIIEKNVVNSDQSEILNVDDEDEDETIDHESKIISAEVRGASLVS